MIVEFTEGGGAGKFKLYVPISIVVHQLICQNLKNLI